MNTNKLIYITDPLCGWCYAVAPIIKTLAASPDLPNINLLHRGLFTGQMTRWMSRSFSDYVMEADQRIQELSGQTFSQAYRDKLFYRNYLIFDSWPTAKATQIVRRYDESKVLPFFEAMQRARFTDGKVITDASVLCQLAESIGLQADQFHKNFHYDPDIDKEAREEQQKAIALMNQVMVNGVPCLLLQQDDHIMRIHHEPFLNNPQGLVEQLLDITA